MIRLALRVPRDRAELVLADLLELAPSGVEEVELPAKDGGAGMVEYVVYGSAGELPELPDLRAAAGAATVEISTSEIADDWSERWKQFHRPVLIQAPVEGHGEGVDPFPAAGPRACGLARVPSLHIRPPWEAPSDRPGVSDIVIDPAQAFGTGAHATTRLSLELLLELASAEACRGAVLDVGAGSGVLAIAAGQLGYGPVLALDNDCRCVTATIDNAAVNGVELEARSFDLRRDALPEIDSIPAPIVLANLLKPLLRSLSATFSSPPRHLIASGLLRSEADGFASELAARHALCERRRLERGDWAALWLTPN